MNDDASTAPDPSRQSKTARKREALHLQELGDALTRLKPAQLERFDLTEKLLHAIETYKRINSREASRRQLQYIGRLMRDSDAAAIAERLAYLDGQSNQARQTFHNIERWRDRLMRDAAAVQQFIDAYPNVDHQQLRQLVRKVTKAQQHRATAGEQAQSGSTKADPSKTIARELFRFLRAAAEVHEASQPGSK